MVKPRVLVPDTSCLILFCQLDRLKLLDDIVASLDMKLVLLSPVLDELRNTPIEEMDKLAHEKIEVKDYESYQYKYRLGKGESAILKFGIENRIIAIIDDFKARKVATELNIDVRGTAGLLGTRYVMCTVKEKNELINILQGVRAKGFYLPELESYISTLQKKTVKVSQR